MRRSLRLEHDRVWCSELGSNPGFHVLGECPLAPTESWFARRHKSPLMAIPQTFNQSNIVKKMIVVPSLMVWKMRTSRCKKRRFSLRNELGECQVAPGCGSCVCNCEKFELHRQFSPTLKYLQKQGFFFFLKCCVLCQLRRLELPWEQHHSLCLVVHVQFRIVCP